MVRWPQEPHAPVDFVVERESDFSDDDDADEAARQLKIPAELVRALILGLQSRRYHDHKRRHENKDKMTYLHSRCVSELLKPLKICRTFLAFQSHHLSNISDSQNTFFLFLGIPKLLLTPFFY